MSRKVAILIFPDVELLDFAGPYEVFTSASSVVAGEAPFEVYTVGETGATIRTRYGLQVTPDYAVAACPPPDILVVPGGRGTRAVITNAALVAWVKAVDGQTALTTSVCTGSLVLGAAGLLDGLQATTHHSAYDELTAAAPKTSVVRGVRFVDNGRIITSAGVQAGMDMALHVVARLHGDDVAQQTADHIEYRWSPQKE
jgi:transcriptional regulator GlxA family with amidase domain